MVRSQRGIINHNQIFKKRSSCIFKKAHELAVLCDIMVCAVIVGPNGEIETRPENPIEAIDLLKQFKDNKNIIFDNVQSANFVVNGAVEEGKRKRNDRKLAQEAIRIKKLDFSFFDEKLLNGFSQKSVLEIRKTLKLKIEAARNRVEFLKSKTGKDQESRAGNGFEMNPTSNFDQPIFNYSEMMLGFQARNRIDFLKKTGKYQESRAGTGFEINPTPNFDVPIFNYSEMMLGFPERNRVGDQESWTGFGFETNPTPTFNEPIFNYSEMMLGFPERNRVEFLNKTDKDQESWAGTSFETNPTPNINEPIFNYSNMMLGFLPPQLNLPGLEYGSNNRFPECYFDSESAYTESQILAGTTATDLENNWNPNFDSVMAYQDSSFHNSSHRSAGSGGVLRNDSGNWLGTGMNCLPPLPASIRVPDCHFGSESALPLKQVIGLLQSSPQDLLGVGTSMASTPLQPVNQQQFDWWFS